MKKHPITLTLPHFPAKLQSLLDGAKIFDYSCSDEAQVLFVDKGGGYFIKIAPKGSLKCEAEMIRYFNSLGLSCIVIDYITEERDYLVTPKIPGENCASDKYLKDPKRLCDTLAEILISLHSINSQGCPVTNHTAEYLKAAEINFKSGRFSKDSIFGFDFTPIDAWNFIESRKHLLKSDTLIHGDYCLPNAILNNWRFSGFIDLGNGGVGDKHVDIFWAIWSLHFNLKTDEYADRFIDAYGRNKINKEALHLVSVIEMFR